MLIEFSGVQYEYDPSKIDVRTAIAIREHTGMGMLSWERGVDDADPLCLQALYWAMLAQNGVRKPMKTIEFSVVEFYSALREAATKEVAARIEAEARNLAADDVPERPTGTASASG